MVAGGLAEFGFGRVGLAGGVDRGVFGDVEFTEIAPEHQTGLGVKSG